MKTTSILLFAIIFIANTHAAIKPQKDIGYGEHERQKLDFWQAKSSKPTPVLIYFHGGAFKMGDKANIRYFFDVKDYLKKGISCITVNYPFLKHRNNDYMAIMKDCEQALEFIKKNAKNWQIDTSRIAVAGTSAGALITEYLSYHTKDVCVMGAILQPMGTEENVIPLVKQGVPPLIIYQPSPNSDFIHHPNNAKLLKKAYDQKKIECELYGSKKNDINPLPRGKDHKEVIMKFFLKHLQ